jgi:hypothetical protein
MFGTMTIRPRTSGTKFIGFFACRSLAVWAQLFGANNALFIKRGLCGLTLKRPDKLHWALVKAEFTKPQF